TEESAQSSEIVSDIIKGVKGLKQRFSSSSTQTESVPTHKHTLSAHKSAMTDEIKEIDVAKPIPTLDEKLDEKTPTDLLEALGTVRINESLIEKKTATPSLQAAVDYTEKKNIEDRFGGVQLSEDELKNQESDTPNISGDITEQISEENIYYDSKVNS